MIKAVTAALLTVLCLPAIASAQTMDYTWPATPTPTPVIGCSYRNEPGDVVVLLRTNGIAAHSECVTVWNASHSKELYPGWRADEVNDWPWGGWQSSRSMAQAIDNAIHGADDSGSEVLVCHASNATATATAYLVTPWSQLLKNDVLKAGWEQECLELAIGVGKLP